MFQRGGRRRSSFEAQQRFDAVKNAFQDPEKIFDLIKSPIFTPDDMHNIYESNDEHVKRILLFLATEKDLGTYKDYYTEKPKREGILRQLLWNLTLWNDSRIFNIFKKMRVDADENTEIDLKLYSLKSDFVNLIKDDKGTIPTNLSGMAVLLSSIYDATSLKFIGYLIEDVFSIHDEKGLYNLQNFVNILFKYYDDAVYNLPFTKKELAETILDASLKLEKDSDKAIVRAAVKSNMPSSWNLIKTNVAKQKNIFTFVWEEFCNTYGQQSLDKLRQYAQELGVAGFENMNKAQLCRALDNWKSQPLQREAAFCALDDTDPWSMDDIKDIPVYRRYKINNKCYDLFSLKQSIDSNVTVNPFTREPLPVQDINEKYDKLKRYTTTRTDLYDRIRDIPILSEETILTRILTGIYEKMKYPPAIEAFTNQTPEVYDKIWADFNDFSVLPISEAEKLRYASATNGKEKLKILIRTMERIASLHQDSNTTTRLQAMEYALSENVVFQNRKREREDGEAGEEEDESPAQRPRLSGGRKGVTITYF